MIPTASRPEPEAPATPGRRLPGSPWAWFLAFWTLGVGLAVQWLIQDAASDPGAPVFLLHDPADASASVGTRIERWLRLAHLSLHGTYPWIVLAPYVVWLTRRFHLEPGRWRISAPVLTGAGVVWLAVSGTYHRFASAAQPDVIVFASVETHDDRPLAGIAPPGPGSGFPSNRTLIRRFEAHTADSPANKDPLPGLISNLLVRVDRHIARIPGAGPPPPGVPSTNGNSGSPREPAWVARSDRFDLDVQRERRFPRLPGLLGVPHISTALLDLFAYISLVGVAHALHFQRRYREREHRALALESSLTHARLHALQAQLQPHFLFNTLNSVTAMLRQDPRTAEEMLVSLSDLLRLALSQSNHQETPLLGELRFVQLYVEIQQFRFGDRLRFETDIEPAAADCLVPTLFLQPLVENAIRHGLEPAGRPVRIRIRARRPTPDRLEITIDDDGVGCPRLPDGRPPTGIGLGNVQARLVALFGKDACLDFPHRASEGFEVRIVLPARTDPRTAPSPDPGPNHAARP